MKRSKPLVTYTRQQLDGLADALRGHSCPFCFPDAVPMADKTRGDWQVIVSRAGYTRHVRLRVNVFCGKHAYVAEVQL